MKSTYGWVQKLIEGIQRKAGHNFILVVNDAVKDVLEMLIFFETKQQIYSFLGTVTEDGVNHLLSYLINKGVFDFGNIE